MVRHIVNANLLPFVDSFLTTLYADNKGVFSDGSPIYLLDGDVGQSEFTPSGCISLWKLSSPILGWFSQVFFLLYLLRAFRR